MSSYHGPVEEPVTSRLWIIGFIIIVVGFILIFTGVLLSVQGTINTGGNTSVGVGGCVIIFFIPICFGRGTGNLWIIGLVIGIVLTIASIVLFTLSRKAFM